MICAFESRSRIDSAIASLRAQNLTQPFEVIAVVSGKDRTAQYLARRHPDIVVVSSWDRVFPGEARNRGVAVARGAVIAFLPDDGIASAGWLRARLRCHEEGYTLVAGAIANGTRRSLVGTASYYIEYAASMPVERLLRRQPIPHTLSYRREVFERLGGFPELDVPGEDTVFNRRCVDAGLRIAYEPRATVAHANLERIAPLLSHARQHGRGLARCVLSQNLDGPFELDRGRPRLAFTALVRYPVLRWTRTIRLLAETAPRHIVPFLLLTPLVSAGYLAGGVGAWDELSASGT